MKTSSIKKGAFLFLSAMCQLALAQTTNFEGVSVYDVDDDGVMELIGWGRNTLAFQYVKDDAVVNLARTGGLWYNWFNISQEPTDDRLIFYGPTRYNRCRRDYANFNVCRQEDDGSAKNLISDKAKLFADIDNDGLSDVVPYYNLADLYLYMQQRDGSFLPTKQQLTDNKQELTESGNAQTLVEFLQGFLRNSMFVDDSSSSLQNLTNGIDFNNDGILDLFDTTTGGMLYSYADGKYFKQPTTSIVYPCDIDGDGLQDYLVFDGETLSLTTNVVSPQSERKELFKNTKIDQVVCRDFDHDGDIDILVCLYNNEVSYFVFLRNNGDGTFRKKETSFEAQYTLLDCRDYDADGQYELLLGTGQYGTTDTKLYRVAQDLTMTEYAEPFALVKEGANLQWSNVIMGDFDHDGYTEFYAGEKDGWGNEYCGRQYGRLNNQTAANTAPQKMQQPTAILLPEQHRLKISWKRGQDTETSTCDLTYEVRIGTAPGQGDIMRATSLSDGRRKTLEAGKQGTALSMLFNTAALKPGTYYISVQAIDQGGLGGPFSDDFVYEHQLTAPKFYMSASQLSTADTLLVYVKQPIADATYQWTVSEGEVISQNEDGALILFHQEGNHTINLTTIIDGTVYHSEPQQVYVDAIAYTDTFGTAASYFYFDFNQDGWIDALTLHKDNAEYTVAYKNNGDGTTSKINLSTFAGLTGKYRGPVVDYDMDGYPDFILGGSSKGDVFLNYGEQDYDFDYQTKGVKYPGGETYLPSETVDLNNDGQPDFLLNGSVCYTRNQMTENEKWYFYDNGNTAVYESLVDINRDGLMDIIYPKSEYNSTTQRSETRWYYILKDSTANCYYTEPRVLFSMPANVYSASTESKIVDFNNDGIPDLLTRIQYELDGTGYLAIFKGKYPEVSSELVMKVEDQGWLSLDEPIDVNNDGYLDLPDIRSSQKAVGVGYEYDHQTLLMKPNFQYELVPDLSLRFTINNFYPLSGDGYFKVGGTPVKTGIRNESPAAPASVTAKQTKDGLVIAWADGWDKETPAVQMRYNVSVKRKGKTGAGSFVISPMNGLKDEAAIVPSYTYLQATQMLIPASVLTAGESYEIQVQSIDMWSQHSPMSAPVEFTMTASGYIDVAERTVIGRETTVKFMGTQADNYTLLPGTDGTIVKDLGNGEFVVTWRTEGVKELTLTAGNTEAKASVMVVKPYNMTFSVPSEVMAGVPLKIAVPADMRTLTTGMGWKCNNSKVSISYTAGDSLAYIIFPETGIYQLEAYSTDEVRGTNYTCHVNVTEQMPSASISHVDADGNNYMVHWNADAIANNINKVVVLREGSSLNKFLVMDTVSADKGYYIDQSSNTLVTANRYSIMLVADNGQTSYMSDIHKPMHVMLAYSAMGGFNLMWNAYEGLTVDNYQIWRGNTFEDMQLLAQVAGSQQSYTDLEPLEGDAYYAVSFNPQVTATARTMQRASTTTEGAVLSNTVSTRQAVSLIPVENIEIVNATDTMLTKEHPDLQLRYVAQPASCSVNQVAWTITGGNDLATISTDGLLHATGGKGIVTVCATTVDGSGVSVEVTIPCDVLKTVHGDLNGDGIVNALDIQIVIMACAEESVETIYDLNGDGIVNALDIQTAISLSLLTP